MKAFIDTNIFVYASYRRFREHETARNFVKACFQGNDRWVLSWGVVYEYLTVVTQPDLFKPEGLSFKEALSNVKQFLASRSIEILQEGENYLNLVETLCEERPELRGSIHHDAHIVTLMHEHDIKTIYTANTDFHRFKNIKVVNPFL